MKTQPIRPAHVDFSDPLAARAPDYGDLYHARAGAFEQARHVFLGGNGLPQRWQGQTRFVILETGFGLGNNFLATWAAWRDDPQACERLVFISIEKHPLRLDDLRRAHAQSPEPSLAAALIAQWPPLTHNLHCLDFEAGRVRLMLAFGDARDWLAELVAEVDAIYLDGFSPALNPDIWDRHLLRRLARLARPGTTAATWSRHPSVLEGLSAAGFEHEKQAGFAKKGRMTAARYAPRHEPQRPAGRAPLAPQARRVMVVGAGIAGAACAHALVRQGMQVLLLDAQPAPAGLASGNPAGLFHGTLNPDDGLHARFNRAAALHTQRQLAPLQAAGALPSLQHGLLRLESQRDLTGMQALIDAQGLPTDYVQALDAEAARRLSGWPLAQPAWYYPGGGGVSPRALCELLLAGCGSALQRQMNAAVDRLAWTGTGWQAWDAGGRQIGQADALVIAAGQHMPALLDRIEGLDGSPSGGLPPLLRQRGQISHWTAARLDAGLRPPLMPIAGAGYALDDGKGGLVFGATHQDEDPDPLPRKADHLSNLAQLHSLCGRQPSAQDLAGRVGWRLIAPDRLPLVGGLALPATLAQERADQVRLLDRVPALALCAAMASRGISWALLCGELVASRLSGSPVPLEASLLDAVDPLRFAVREQRSRRR